MSVSAGLSSLLWFIVILAAIPVSMWLLKRTPMGGAGTRGLRSVSSLPLSASQRIVTIEVGEGDDKRWLVLGVTPASITTLHTMQAQPSAEPSPAVSAVHPAFARILERLQRPAAAASASASPAAGSHAG